MKRITKTEKQIIVDQETGEVLDVQTTETTKTFTAKVSSERFFFLYSSFITLLGNSKDQPSRTALAVFGNLLEHYHPSGIGIVKKHKEEIATKLGISIRYVEKCIKELVDCSLLIRKGQSFYMINPLFIFQGTSDERKNIIEVTFK